MKNNYIWVGIIPGIFGYGISVASKTKAGAMKALKVSYQEWKSARQDEYITTFEESFEYWGGYVNKIQLDEDYIDGFKR